MTLIAFGAALPITAALWYPEWQWPAAIVGMAVALWGAVREVTRPQAKPGWVRSPERRRARWLPAMGVGVSVLRWPPRLYAYLGLWRWRR